MLNKKQTKQAEKAQAAIKKAEKTRVLFDLFLNELGLEAKPGLTFKEIGDRMKQIQELENESIQYVQSLISEGKRASQNGATMQDLRDADKETVTG